MLVGGELVVKAGNAVRFSTHLAAISVDVDAFFFLLGAHRTFVFKLASLGIL